MPRFSTTEVVDAYRADAHGTIVMDGTTLIGSPGQWVVVFPDGTHRTIPHEQFITEYKPCDEEAQRYLDEMCRLVLD